jgi:hypothetical protein
MAGKSSKTGRKPRGGASPAQPAAPAAPAAGPPAAPAPAGPPAPAAAEVAPGFALLALILLAVFGWAILHFGVWAGVGALFGAFVAVGGFFWGFLLQAVKEEASHRYTRALAVKKNQRRLGVALLVVLLLACALTTVRVELDGVAAKDGVKIQVGDGAGAKTEVVTSAEPYRRLGFAFMSVPTFRSGAFRHVGGSFPPLLPLRYRYPLDFEPRPVLLVLPDDALFFGMDETWRLRVRDEGGAVVADTTLGGPAGTMSAWIEGEPSEADFAAAVRGKLASRDPADVIDQHVAAWLRHVHVEPRVPLKMQGTVTVELLHEGEAAPAVTRRVRIGVPVEVVLLSQS